MTVQESNERDTKMTDIGYVIDDDNDTGLAFAIRFRFFGRVSLTLFCSS